MTADRHSLNRAFREAGLRFQWDERDWAVLGAMPDVRAQLAWWLPRHQPHLLKVYDVDFLGVIVEQRLAAPGADACDLEANGSR